MQCPECGSLGRVSSTFDHGVTVLRYRRCPMCDHRWRTWEEKDPHPVKRRQPKVLPKADLFTKSDDIS